MIHRLVDFGPQKGKSCKERLTLLKRYEPPAPKATAAIMPPVAITAAGPVGTAG